MTNSVPLTIGIGRHHNATDARSKLAPASNVAITQAEDELLERVDFISRRAQTLKIELDSSGHLLASAMSLATVCGSPMT